MNTATVSLSEVVDRARSLPAAPWLLPKLMTLLADPDAAADQVEELIRMDSGLASGTLRLANSAYFNGAAPCESLTEAIVRLGFREVYRLATTTIAGGWLNKQVDGYGWEPGDLYRHSLTVAVAADLLAKQTQLVNAETAYTAGLLHDVGKLALAYACGGQFDRIRRVQYERENPWREAEHEVLGFDHTDVAGELLVTWKFPPSLVQVVRFYPQPRRADDEHRPLVTHVHAAKHIALCLGTGVGEEGFQSEIDEHALHEAGITPEITEALLPAVFDLSTKLLQGEMPG
ncbi:MAG TPA: HDOD domain-containing protein [Opitutaceae bacterium]|nr:HDOD domain-containing protein [Opitutaceae bacterium]